MRFKPGFSLGVSRAGSGGSARLGHVLPSGRGGNGGSGRGEPGLGCALDTRLTPPTAYWATKWHLAALGLETPKTPENTQISLILWGFGVVAGTGVEPVT